LACFIEKFGLGWTPFVSMLVSLRALRAFRKPPTRSNTAFPSPNYYILRKNYYILRKNYYILRKNYYILRKNYYILRKNYYILRKNYYILRKILLHLDFRVIFS